MKLRYYIILVLGAFLLYSYYFYPKTNNLNKLWELLKAKANRKLDRIYIDKTTYLQ